MARRGKDKRNSYPYKAKYFKHNKGVFHEIYFCAQCGRKLKRTQVEVDHIIPISKWYGPNRLFNCVATCLPCNRRKSAKVNKKFIIKGYTSKILEEITILIQNIIMFFLIGIIVIINYIIRKILGLNFQSGLLRPVLGVVFVISTVMYFIV